MCSGELADFAGDEAGGFISTYEFSLKFSLTLGMISATDSGWSGIGA